MTSAASLAFLPAHELARRVRQREVSAVELLELYIGRVERLNPRINAVVVLDLERALAAARAADAALAQGRVLGPLHGVPMTVKEAFDLPGTPSTWGFERLRDNIAGDAAEAVKRLQRAGAVVFGKTNVPANLADWQTFNPVYGTTNNPWDPTRGPGGSSGGSAAALAAGLTALELGSDIGASIRNPAHYCGVWGHKPTWGVVSMQGHGLPGAECHDTTDIAAVGPMARSAHDLALAMDVLAGAPQAFGPLGWLPVAWRDPGTPPARMKVAVIADDACAEVDGSVQSALARLAGFLRGRGVRVDEGARPVASREAYETYLWLLRSATGAALADDEYALARERAAQAERGGDRRPGDDYAAWIWQASTLSHRDWVHHDQVRQKLRRQWAEWFQTYDLLICPVATTPAFAHNQQGWRWERMIPVNGKPQPSTDQLFWAGYPGLVGLPATAVPLALSDEGLPIGAQIIGATLADPMCLRFARWLEDEYRGFVAPPGWD
jgi:amidase